MAVKKDKEEDSSTDTHDQRAITKFLIKEMNKGVDGPMAWNLNDPNPTDVKEFISTGSTLLDYMISNKRNGGVPAGKLTEIVGEEGSGKSLLATQILANTQKKGGIAIYIDTENAANPDFMKRLGMDLNKLVYLQPGSIEECYGTIEKTIMMARTKNTTCPVTIVWDSTAATPPQAEIEGDYDPNSRIGLAAKAHAKGLRKLTKAVGFDKVTLIFTNQLKVKIGVMFGDPMTTPGGKAVPYHSSVRIRLTKSKEQAEGAGKQKETLGFNTIAKVFKNRLGPPMRRCEFKIMFDSGVDDLDAIRDYLWEVKGFISKKGGFMVIDKYKGEELKFRAGAFRSMMLNTDGKWKGFREYIEGVLEGLLVIRFDKEDDDHGIELDTDSVLEMEQLASEVSQ